MINIFINGTAVRLPERFVAGQEFDENSAAMLNFILHRRVSTKLRSLLSKGDIAVGELQRKGEALCEVPMIPYATLDDEDDIAADPIFAEALTIARDIIISRMAAEGLPPPRGLDDHAKALVNARPDLQEFARKRMEARLAAANEALGLLAP